MYQEIAMQPSEEKVWFTCMQIVMEAAEEARDNGMPDLADYALCIGRRLLDAKKNKEGDSHERR